MHGKSKVSSTAAAAEGDKLRGKRLRVMILL